MFKKSIIVGIVSCLIIPVQGSVQDRRSERRLKAAIASLDVATVEKILKKQNTLSQETRKELLESAEDAVEQCETAFIKKDIVSSLVGSLSTLLGFALLVAPALDKRMDPDEKPIFYAVGSILSPVGLYFSIKGLKGAARASYLDRAERIVDLIQEKVGTEQ